MTGRAAAAVGVDAGGSRTRALALDRDGGEAARWSGPPAAVDPRDPGQTVRALEDLLRRGEAEGGIELPVEALCAGVAGAGRAEVRKRLETELAASGLARHVRVLTDGEVALADAHGDGPGLLLVSGTGSVAWGRNGRGEVARAGGWGPLLGDEGSGHALARAALRRTTRAADGRETASELAPRLLDRLCLDAPEDLVAWVADASRAEVAALAPAVVELADAGVRPAREIVDEAVEELVAAVEAVLGRLGPWDEPPPLALAGGLLDPDGPLRPRVARAAERLDIRVEEGAVDPVRGAARLALEAAGAG